MAIIGEGWITGLPEILSPNMPTPVPDFEKEFIRAIRRNLTDVVGQLDLENEGLLKKIDTFSTRFKFPESAIRRQIRNDEMFRAFFAKDPGKQKIHENIAADFIRKIPTVEDFKQLSHGALQLVRGGIFPKKEALRMGTTAQAKTLDFSWKTGKSNIFASHKYTKSSGGAQDNQYNDLKDFISEANDSNLPDTIFLAIADGNYYQLFDTEARVKKIQRLKDLANRRNVFAVTSVELEKFTRGNQ